MARRTSIFIAVAALTATVAVTSAGARPVAATATTIKQGGSTGEQLRATALASRYNKIQKNVVVTVTGGGSGVGIQGAANGTFDIGDSSRDPAPSDPSSVVFTKTAREPFVIAVNPKNPISNLTTDQIKAILTGSVRDWKQVGWAKGGPIKVYGRIATSGTSASCRSSSPAAPTTAPMHRPSPRTDSTARRLPTTRPASPASRWPT